MRAILQWPGMMALAAIACTPEYKQQWHADVSGCGAPTDALERNGTIYVATGECLVRLSESTGEFTRVNLPDMGGLTVHPLHLLVLGERVVVVANAGESGPQHSIAFFDWGEDAVSLLGVHDLGWTQGFGAVSMGEQVAVVYGVHPEPAYRHMVESRAYMALFDPVAGRTTLTELGNRLSDSFQALDGDFLFASSRNARLVRTGQDTTTRWSRTYETELAPAGTMRAPSPAASSASPVIANDGQLALVRAHPRSILQFHPGTGQQISTCPLPDSDTILTASRGGDLLMLSPTDPGKWSIQTLHADCKLSRARALNLTSLGLDAHDPFSVEPTASGAIAILAGEPGTLRVTLHRLGARP